MAHLLPEVGSLDQGVAMSALAGGATYAMCVKLSQFFSPLATASYTKLSARDRMDWDCRLPSTVHALVVTATAVQLFLFSTLFSDSKDREDPVIYRTSTLSDLALGFSVGYFLTDLACMYQNPGMWQPEMAAHHIAALASVAAAAFRHHAHNYTLALLATECTTPFINMRWLLDKAGQRDSRAYVANGLTLLLAWLLGRITLFFYFFDHALRHEDEIRQLPVSSMLLVVAVPVLLFTLNVFWFTKIVKGAVKILFGKPKQQVRGMHDVDAALTEPIAAKDQ